MKWRIAAVIPNWNGAGRLDRCLASLAAQRRKFDQVIVVDNASTDGSQVHAQIRLPENRGFAVAVNRGISAAVGADWIAILNNDVVLDPEWLEALLDRGADYLLLTGRTLQSLDHTRLDGAGDALSLGLAAARLGHGALDGDAYATPREVFGVCFAASLVHADVFRKVGLLEERFFAYLEDVDFCLRAQLAGFRAWYAPDAIAYHEGSASSSDTLSPRIAEWMTENQLLLAARYASFADTAMLRRIALVQTLWAARMIRRGRALSWIRGIFAAAGQWSGMRKEIHVDYAAVGKLLRESEQLIRNDACVSSEPFWKHYFSKASA